MRIVATTQEQLSESLAKANTAGERVEDIDLRPLNQIVDYCPEDLTVTVQAGSTLATLQGHLAQRGQWLPIDPPGADTLTIWDLLKFNLSGPRRYGFGTIREHLIGLKAALPDGRLIKSGGKVVKNVAGYDLLKLFVGDRGTLGVAVEASFKVRPLPESEQFVHNTFTSLPAAGAALDAVLDSPLTPTVLDLHGSPTSVRIVLGFSGTAAEVAWSVGEAAKLGIDKPATLAYSTESDPRSEQHLSVLPSRLIETLQRVGPTAFVCRAGNGIIYYRGKAAEQSTTPLPQALMGRLKDTFDPKHILPEFPL